MERKQKKDKNCSIFKIVSNDVKKKENRIQARLETIQRDLHPTLDQSKLWRKKNI